MVSATIDLPPQPPRNRRRGGRMVNQIPLSQSANRSWVASSPTEQLNSEQFDDAPASPVDWEAPVVAPRQPVDTHGRMEEWRSTLPLSETPAMPGLSAIREVSPELNVESPLPTPKPLPPVTVWLDEGDDQDSEPEITTAPPQPTHRAQRSVSTVTETLPTQPAPASLNNAPVLRQPTMERDGNSTGTWWKQPPLAQHNPDWARQRLHVELPFPLELAAGRKALLRHFYKFPNIISHAAIQARFRSAFVVFTTEENATRCLHDPQAASFLFSSDELIQEATIHITLTRPPALNPRCTLSVRIPPSVAGEEDPTSQALPEKVTVYGVPTYNRNHTKVVWWARMLPPGQDPQVVWGGAQRLTKCDVALITELSLSAKPKGWVFDLCNTFCNIVRFIPPQWEGQGYLVTPGTPHEAQMLLKELQQIPGLDVRWADPSRDPHLPDDLAGLEVANYARADSVRGAGSVTGLVPSPAQPPSSVCPSEQYRPSIAPSIVASQPSQYLPSVCHEPRGSFRREWLSTYKGRVLTQAGDGDDIAFIDEAAVHIGRLTKAETQNSLLRRFVRYGKINQIEFRPHSSEDTTYTTARILYASKEAAQAAISSENGVVSHGSKLRVEVRRVLPTDVKLKEMVVDCHGRAVSPSLLSQADLSPQNSTASSPRVLPPPAQPPWMTWSPFPIAPPATGAPVIPHQPYVSAVPPMSSFSAPFPGLGPPPTMPMPYVLGMPCLVWPVPYQSSGASPNVPAATPPQSPGCDRTATQMPQPLEVPAPAPPSPPSSIKVEPGSLPSRQEDIEGQSPAKSTPTESVESCGQPAPKSLPPLVPKGFRTEDGMVVAVYDEEQLAAYKAAQAELSNTGKNVKPVAEPLASRITEAIPAEQHTSSTTIDSPPVPQTGASALRPVPVPFADVEPQQRPAASSSYNQDWHHAHHAEVTKSMPPVIVRPPRHASHKKNGRVQTFPRSDMEYSSGDGLCSTAITRHPAPV